MRKALFIALAGAALGALPASTAVAHGPRSAECTIDVARTHHGLRFDALARSRTRASGEYELVITKSGRGGSADIVQGGAFQLGAGEENLLGSSELSLDRGGRYRARLVLWDGDRVVCRVVRRS